MKALYSRILRNNVFRWGEVFWRHYGKLYRRGEVIVKRSLNGFKRKKFSRYTGGLAGGSWSLTMMALSFLLPASHGKLRRRPSCSAF
jgi:hypothetical protein